MKKVAKKESITIFIPAYNEEKNLETTVHTCNNICKEFFHNYELLIINDGSTDKTAEIAKQLAKNNPHIRVSHNKRNMGLGYSYRKAIQIAKKEYLMWVAGDNEFTSDAIKSIIRHIGEADVVISHNVNQTVRPLYRRIISRTFTKVINLLFNLNLKYYTGLILCKTKLLQKLRLSSNSSSLLAEIVIKLVKTGHTYKCIPVCIRKRMSRNVLRLKDIFATVKMVLNLFIEFHFYKGKNIFR
jgi:glycosyltransferase involved in cell wall biosynthesis